MKKRLIKVLLPIAAMLLSSCDFFSFLEDTPSGEQSNTGPEIIIHDDPTDKTSGDSFDGYPTSINIDASLPLLKGQTKSLTASLSPTNAKYKTVIWETENKSIATVSNGEIKGVGVGKTKIIASTINNKGETITSTCNVVVTDPNHITKRKLLYTYDDYTANSMYNVDNCPLTGSPKLLVVPIWFDDSDQFISLDRKEDIRDDIRKSFLGTKEETGWHSVASYYKEESLGQVTMTGTVTDWYETGTSYQTYAPESATSATTALVDTVAKWYFDSHSSDPRTNYDTNGDGFLDAVILVYAAPDSQSISGDNGNLWAYTYWNQYNSANITDPQSNAYFWGSYDFMYSAGQDAFLKTDQTDYGHGDTRYSNVDAHCFIHEMGHVLGLQDYYDYSNQHEPAGGFSMQDMNVGGHDPYSVMAYGWANPYVPSSSMTITINDFQSSHDLILLANHSVTSPFDEYLLLELYTPTGLNEFDTKYAYKSGYPQGAKDVGLRVWHVDARLTYPQGYGFSKTLTTNPKSGNVYHAMSNTYYVGDYDPTGHASPLGKEYSEFNLLQLVHKVKKTGDIFSASSLFKYSSTFAMDSFTSQFVNNTKMNDGNDLGWTFSVDAMDSSSASITINKL